MNIMKVNFLKKIKKKDFKQTDNRFSTVQEINKKAMENCKHLFTGNANRRNKNNESDSLGILNNDSNWSKNNIEKILSNNNTINRDFSTINNDSINYNSKNNFERQPDSNSNLFGGKSRRQMLNINSNIDGFDKQFSERNYMKNETGDNVNFQTNSSFVSAGGKNNSNNNLTNNLSKYKHIFTDSSIKNTTNNNNSGINTSKNK